MSYDYILYVDEAGDPGLRTVRPLDENGASEWMVLAGVLVAQQNNDEVLQRVATLPSMIGARSSSGIHFKKLAPYRKLAVCTQLATWPVRSFVVCSNKRNMRGQHDAKPHANIVEVKSWFYAWLFRLLLERVSQWVARRSMKDLGRIGTLKIELSQRGGVRYVGMRAYVHWLSQTFSVNKGALQEFGGIDFRVLSLPLIEDFMHNERPGLQMADWTASAFFKAVDKYQTGAVDNSFAKALGPRLAIAPNHPNPAGFGVKLMPGWGNRHLKSVDGDQLEIFRHFGYPNEWRENW